MLDTEERRTWERLTTAAMVERFGAQLKAGICHIDDESYFHVHYLVDCNGGPVRHLHAGHAAADAEPVKSLKGERFRNSCKEALDFYFDRIGKPLGWLRMSPTPRPHGRVSRSQAQRNRQLQQENEAAELRKRNFELEQKAQALAAAHAQHRENEKQFDADLAEGDAYLNRRLAEIDSAEEFLKREHERVQAMRDEYESKKARIEAEAAVMWRTIGDAAERTKAWEGEVRDQVALEQRVARVRGMVRPGGGRGVADCEDDDLSDVPF